MRRRGRDDHLVLYATGTHVVTAWTENYWVVDSTASSIPGSLVAQTVPELPKRLVVCPSG